MQLRDLRAYINALKEIGEVQEIDQEVDLDLEIGAIIRRSYELRAPAPLFNHIKGVEAGFRILGAPVGVSNQPGLYLSRVALSLGLEPQTSGAEIMERLAEAYSKPLQPPQEIPTAPCKENIAVGDDVDITRFPSPLLHGGDGGRYINTFGVIVAQTPDKKWTNWSIARIMLLDGKRMTGIVKPKGQHLGMIHQMWKQQGKSMPFALATGVEPAVAFVGGMPLPEYANEADFIGAYLERGVEVVKCETVELFVPASAEIVIEGHISDTEVAPEGPMGEYAGYNWIGVSSPKPVYNVTAMTWRNEPILPVAVAGEPIEEDHSVWGLGNSAIVLHELRQAGLPVTMAWTPLEAANHWLVVTFPMDWRDRTGLHNDELIQKIGDVLFNSHAGAGMIKVLVMEDDVDPTNTNEVVWAFATRSHPGTSEHIFPREQTGALAVYFDEDEKRTMVSAKVIYDCLTRDEWTHGNKPSRTNFAKGYSAEVRDRVLANWCAYGYSSDE